MVQPASARLVSRGSGPPAAIAISRRVNAERLVLLAWPRAILLQMAHPLVAAAVVDHSSFRDGALSSVRRLHSTARAMLGLAFGDEHEQAKVIGGIRAIHRRIHGTLREQVGMWPAGAAYSAEDPALLLWVHATLAESSILAYETLVRPLAPDDRDAYCEETAGVAVALGAVADRVPRSWADLDQYLADMYASNTIAVGSDARVVSAAVLGGSLPALSGPLGWIHRRVTAGWLPPAIRDAYGLPWSGRHERQFTRIVGGIRRGRAILPRAVAWWQPARAVSPPPPA